MKKNLELALEVYKISNMMEDEGGEVLAGHQPIGFGWWTSW